MDKEHVKSATKKAEGTLKEAAGKAVGDKSLEMKGSSASPIWAAATFHASESRPGSPDGLVMKPR